jgi:hypothetical protein
VARQLKSRGNEAVIVPAGGGTWTGLESEIDSRKVIIAVDIVEAPADLAGDDLPEAM